MQIYETLPEISIDPKQPLVIAYRLSRVSQVHSKKSNVSNRTTPLNFSGLDVLDMCCEHVILEANVR